MTEGTSSPSWCNSSTSTKRNSTASTHSQDHAAAPKGRRHTLGGDEHDCEKADHAGDYSASARHEENNGSQPPHDSQVDIHDPNRPKLALRQRLRHFTWAWYTLPMSTGGLSLLIYAQPLQFPGLRTAGLVVYIANILIFTTVTLCMLLRFFWHAGTFSRSIRHEREGFFFPTLFLSIATLITSTERYAVPKHNESLIWAVQGVFWVYVAATLVLAIGQYSFVFATHNFGLHTMMPTWILPIFPIMLSGTIASVIGEAQPDIVAIPINIAGLTCQGLGFSVALMMYAHMVGRLMQSGLPDREHRPGLFMCVGPPSFTALALIGMAKGLPPSLDLDRDGRLFDVGIIRILANMSAISLWALSLWWFGIAFAALARSWPRYFHLGWWAMVFPNTGFTLATIAVAEELDNHVIKWVTAGMSLCILVTYCFVLYHHVRAFCKQDIMYPGRDEDVADQ